MERNIKLFPSKVDGKRNAVNIPRRDDE